MPMEQIWEEITKFFQWHVPPLFEVVPNSGNAANVLGMFKFYLMYLTQLCFEQALQEAPCLKIFL